MVEIQEMRFYAGIDGGGTKTTCVIGDDANLLASAMSSGSNIIRLGEEQTRMGIHDAVLQACSMVGVLPDEISAVCVGAAGSTRKAESETLERIVSEIAPAAKVEILGDMEVAMEVALGDHPGVVVIAGTGSIAFGRNEQGQTARAGGWGSAISDDGSGQWIGREAVSGVMRAFDAGKPAPIEDDILDFWQLRDRDDLVRYANSNPHPDFSALVPLVHDCASRGDIVALRVLHAAGRELAALCLIALLRLWPRNHPVRVAMAGGVFANLPEVRQSFFSTLHEHWRTAGVSFRIADPVVGALMRARKLVTHSHVSER